MLAPRIAEARLTGGSQPPGRSALFEQAVQSACRLIVQHDAGLPAGCLAMVYLAVDESPQPVKIAARPGQRLPIFCTASGKAVLAFSSEEVVKRIFDLGFTQYTARSMRDPETLLKSFESVRERGFAYSQEEFEEGINAVAAPILDEKQLPLAAIAVVGPAFRLPVERMLEVGPSVAEAARKIIRELQFAVP